MSAFVPGCDHQCHHVFDRVKLRKKSLHNPSHTGSGRIQTQIKGPGVGKPVLLTGISNGDAFPEESPYWFSEMESGLQHQPEKDSILRPLHKSYRTRNRPGIFPTDEKTWQLSHPRMQLWRLCSPFSCWLEDGQDG